MGPGRRTRRAAARDALEQEAAEIIEARIADGRPPPEVWRAAAERQAAKDGSADAWYSFAEGPESEQQDVEVAPTVGRDLALRVVRLPLAPGPDPAPTVSKRGAGTPRLVAGKSN